MTKALPRRFMSISSGPGRYTPSISPFSQHVRIPATSLPPGPGTKPRSSPPTRAAAVCNTLKPFQSSRIMPVPIASLRARARMAAPSVRAHAKDQHRLLRRFEGLAPFVLAGGQFLERLGPRAEWNGGICQIALGSDHADLEPALQPALAQARVDDRRLDARIGADQETGISLFDPGNGGVEHIARTAGRIERGPVLAAIVSGRTQLS